MTNHSLLLMPFLRHLLKLNPLFLHLFQIYAMSSFKAIQGRNKRGHMTKQKRSDQARTRDFDQSRKSAAKRMVNFNSVPVGTFIPGRGHKLDVDDDEGGDHYTDEEILSEELRSDSEDEYADANEQWLDHLRRESAVPEKFDSPARMQAFIHKQKDIIQSLIRRNREIDSANRALTKHPDQFVTVSILRHILLPPQFYSDKWGSTMRPLCTAMKIQRIENFVSYLDYSAAHFSIHAPLSSGRWCYGCMRNFSKFQTQRSGSFPVRREPYENLMADIIQATEFLLSPSVKATCVVPNYSFCPSSAYYASFLNYPWHDAAVSSVQQLRHGHSWISQTGMVDRSPAMDQLIVGNIAGNFPVESLRVRDTYMSVSWADMVATEDADSSAAPMWIKTETQRVAGEKALVPYDPRPKIFERKKNRARSQKKQQRLRENPPPPPPIVAPQTSGLRGGMLEDDQPEIPALSWKCGLVIPPDYRHEHYVPEWCTRVPYPEHGLELRCSAHDASVALFIDQKVTFQDMCAHSVCWGWTIEYCKYVYTPGWGHDAQNYLKSALITPEQGMKIFSVWDHFFPATGMGTKPGMKEGVEENPGPLFIQDWLALGSWALERTAPRVSQMLSHAETTIRCFRATHDFGARLDQLRDSPIASLFSTMLELRWIERQPRAAAMSYSLGLVSNVAIPLLRQVTAVPRNWDPFPRRLTEVLAQSYDLHGAVGRVISYVRTDWGLLERIRAWLPRVPPLPPFPQLPQLPSIFSFSIPVFNRPNFMIIRLPSIDIGGYSAYLQSVWSRLMHSVTGNSASSSRPTTRQKQAKNLKRKLKKNGKEKPEPEPEPEHPRQFRKARNFKICRTWTTEGFCARCQDGWNPRIANETLRCFLSKQGIAEPCDPNDPLFITKTCAMLATDDNFVALSHCFLRSCRGPPVPDDFIPAPLRLLDPFEHGHHLEFDHAPEAVVTNAPFKEQIGARVDAANLEITPTTFSYHGYGIIQGCTTNLNLNPPPKFSFNNPSFDRITLGPDNWLRFATDNRAHPTVVRFLREHPEHLAYWGGAKFELSDLKFWEPGWWGRVLPKVKYLIEWKAPDPVTLDCPRFLDGDVTDWEPDSYTRFSNTPPWIAVEKELTLLKWWKIHLSLGSVATIEPTQSPHVMRVDRDTEPLALRHELPKSKQLEPHASNIGAATVRHVRYFEEGFMVDEAFYSPEACHELGPMDYGRSEEMWAAAWAALDRKTVHLSYPSCWRPHVCRSKRFFRILNESTSVVVPEPKDKKGKIGRLAWLGVAVFCLVALVRALRPKAAPTIAECVEPNPGP